MHPLQIDYLKIVFIYLLHLRILILKGVLALIKYLFTVTYIAPLKSYCVIISCGICVDFQIITSSSGKSNQT